LRSPRRNLPADGCRLELLCGADPQAALCAKQRRAEAYFEFNKVLTDGVFYAANQLYGLTFKERKDIRLGTGHEGVPGYDKDGSELAIFMIDPWKRDNKNGGAWMSNLVNQSYLRKTKPVVFNVEEFYEARTRPACVGQLG
jgi:peptidyl-dipeptidase Dcp